MPFSRHLSSFCLFSVFILAEKKHFYLLIYRFAIFQFCTSSTLFSVIKSFSCRPLTAGLLFGTALCISLKIFFLYATHFNFKKKIFYFFLYYVSIFFLFYYVTCANFQVLYMDSFSYPFMMGR